MNRPDEPADRIGPIWVYLVALALFFVRFGYGYAIGDHDEILPYLQHVLEASLFTNDWFVQTQAGGFGVRTYFVTALAPFCRVFPVEWVVLTVYLLLWLAIANAAYRLALTFVGSKTAAAVAVVTSLGLLHKWTLGSNDLIYSMLVPEMAAWALAIPAVRFWSVGRRPWSAVLLGVAAWFQILVGILVFAVLCIEHLWATAKIEDRTTGRNAILKAIVWFGLASMPVVIPIALQQFGFPAGTADPSVFYILAPFRNPGHYMLLSFPTKSMVRFGFMIVAGAGALWWLDAKNGIDHAGVLWRIGIIIVAASGLMFAFTEWVPVLVIAKFQLYKLTVLLKLLLLILISAAVVRTLPTALTAFTDGFLSRGRQRRIALVVVMAACALGWMSLPEFVDDRLIAPAHSRSDLGQMELWIADNTDRDAVFAIPPSNSSFRSNARRAIVVNFMAFPYSDVDMVEWYERLQAVAPLGLVETGLNVRPKLDAAFAEQTAADWKALAKVYGLEFVLREGDLAGLEVVHGIGEWKLLRAQ